VKAALAHHGLPFELTKHELGTVGRTGSLLYLLAGIPGMDFRAHDLAAPNDPLRFRPHGGHYSDLGARVQLY
jgi:hypothetical protein